MSKAILVLFKDYKELREWGTDYLLPIARRDDYSQYFDCHSDTHYKLGLMERSTIIGRYANDVYFVNCSIDDCKDEEIFRDLHVLKSWGTNVHYDPKDTEELQSNLKKLDSLWKQHENQRTDNCFIGYQKCSPKPFDECEPRDDSFDEVTFEQREDGRYFRRFATVGELVDALQKLPRDYKIFHTNYYESDSSPSLYYFGDKSFEII